MTAPQKTDVTEHSRAPDVAARLPSASQSVSVARHALLGVLEAEEALDGRLHDIVLATSEAVTNAIQHGSSGKEPGVIEIGIWRDDGEVTVAVTDEGGGITPRISDDAVGLGVGLPIMIALADDVRFSRRGRTFEVALRFLLDEQDVA